MTTKTFYIYRITDPVTGRYYLGIPTGTFVDPADDLRTLYIQWRGLNKTRTEQANNTWTREVVATFPVRSLAEQHLKRLLQTNDGLILNTAARRRCIHPSVEVL